MCSSRELVAIECRYLQDRVPGSLCLSGQHDCRVLLWRRNDNLCFIMAPGGGSIPKGTPVRCNVEGVVQVENADPPTALVYLPSCH